MMSENSSKKSIPEEPRSGDLPKQTKKRRRSVYVCATDRKKRDPFAVQKEPVDYKDLYDRARSRGGKEPQAQKTEENDQRLLENIPPHFGKI